MGRKESNRTKVIVMNSLYTDKWILSSGLIKQTWDSPLYISMGVRL